MITSLGTRCIVERTVLDDKLTERRVNEVGNISGKQLHLDALLSAARSVGEGRGSSTSPRGS